MRWFKIAAIGAGILIAFLPREKILVEADLYTPPAANAAAASGPVNPAALALLDNLEKLRLDFDTILPLHGPGKVTRADLYAFVAKPLVPMASLLAPPPARAAAGARGGRGGGQPAAAVSAEDAPLQAMLEATCSACHTLDRVNAKKADKDGWTTTVTRMVDHGARLAEDDAPRLIDFLARTHGQ